MKKPSYEELEERIEELEKMETVHKKTEEALRESEERYKKLSEATFEGIVFHEKGKILDINRTYANMIGYEISEIIGRDALDFIAPEYRDLVYKNIITEYEKPYEALGLRRDNTTFPIEIRGKAVHYQGRIARVAVVRDTTQRKKTEEERKILEQQLFHSQKMESIGRLAGSIAHDFNNILTGIMGWAMKLKSKYEDTSTIEGKAGDVIFKSTIRAVELTQQLLDFARKRKYNPVKLNINVVIKETAEVLEKALGKDISIHYDFKNEINYVEADKNQIQQVLTNIIINAKDAMPSGGKLIFKTENVDIDDENSKIYPDLNKGNYVKVSIIDSGIGMTEEIKEKIFEPFFTTKEESKGTGLGLATAYGIIKNHKGHITFNSEQNKGTIFIIYLPVSEISQNK